MSVTKEEESFVDRAFDKEIQRLIDKHL